MDEIVPEFIGVDEKEPAIYSQYNRPVTGYYRIRQDYERYKEDGFIAGELIYVFADTDKAKATVGKYTFGYPYKDEAEMADFSASFEFVPDGDKLRQQQIVDLMTEINDIDLTMAQSQVKLESFNPYAGTSGELAGSSSLVPTGTSMQATKFAVANVRNSFMRAKKELATKTDKLQSWLGEQTKALEARAKKLTELVAKAEQAIWTINLYMGKDQEIVILRTGEPAPITDKITLRQNIMYMDSECGLNAREDGIDITNIQLFDEWLLANEANLTQIVPESKGIVALNLRKTDKQFDDPWVTAQVNKDNHMTYFLIRNGENLYRIYIDLAVGSHLFPSASEFEEYFWTYKTDWDDPTHPRIKVPLVPGSDKYIEAMDAADEHHKHYLRVVLVLQGLMDRTDIFKPMPIDKINFCDPKHCEEWIKLIYESENVLTDGNPLFRQWQQRINDTIDIGHRIIGVFGYKVRGSKRDYEEDRVTPRTAKSPDSMVLYTITKKNDYKYTFLYDRTGETVYTQRKDDWRRDHYRGREPLTRASCWIEKTDSFILDFDAASITDIEYYSKHKLSRQYYKDLVPLLEVALELKQKELADEAPFKQLLIGQIMSHYGIDQLDAESKIDELIKWWKYKNRTHRALLSEDKKALDMIVTEFGLRRKQETIRTQIVSVNDGIIRIIGAQAIHPVMIAHKSDNKYVAYVPSNDQNVWVTEQTWTYNRQTGNVTLKETKEWKLVDKRHQRWEIIYKTSRWDSWTINPLMSEVMTDMELAKLVDEGIKRCEARVIESIADQIERKTEDRHHDDNEIEHGRFLPLCASHSIEFGVKLWYTTQAAIIPTELIINSGVTEPTVRRMNLKWKRGKDGIELAEYLGGDNDAHYERVSPPWATTYEEKGDEKPTGMRTIKIWPENIAKLNVECEAIAIHEKMVEELKDKYDHIEKLVRDKMYDIAVVKAKVEFDTEYGDPGLWDDHFKALKLEKHDPPFIDKAIWLLQERDIEVEGLTLKQVYEQAEQYDDLIPNHVRDGWYEKAKARIPEGLLNSFIITAKPPTVEEGE